ncbi:MAG: hypothetical protein KatS3mg005_3534 [Bryobacteraceae bacterium]|nr:MAG: hypothetical protein KatS3mg005_3534 [Bryobacteraceae bacterium]
MRCVDCGKGRMHRKRTPVPHEIHGISFEVEDTVHVCDVCGFITIPWDRLRDHGRLVDATYRRLAGILTQEEIRESRRRLGLSQREFAEYLGVGVASVKRWEKGVLPDKSSSDLIRLKTDPETARRNWTQLKSLLSKHAPPAAAKQKKSVRQAPQPAVNAVKRRAGAARGKS